MTTPIETLNWLSAQFRDRAKEDAEEHTEQDARQVEQARAAFAGLLLASEEVLISDGYNTRTNERRASGPWLQLFTAYEMASGKTGDIPHVSERDIVNRLPILESLKVIMPYAQSRIEDMNETPDEYSAKATAAFEEAQRVIAEAQRVIAEVESQANG